MKLLSQNLPLKRIFSLILISMLNFVLLLGMQYLFFKIFPYAPDEIISIFFLILLIISTLPIIIYILGKIDSAIGPMSYNDLYVKTINSILSIDSFEEILHEVFDSVIIIIKAGFGRIICFHTESDVFDIHYENNKSHELFHREKTNSDDDIISYINGPHDIITRSKTGLLSSRRGKLDKIMDDLDADIAIPVYYNNRVLGLIAIGKKKRFSEREIRLLKIIANKLAILSVNSFYFRQIRKRKEVEKEYILTNRIQKQFLPDPNLHSGKIIIKAHHETASSLTREFYDIFVNDKIPNDIRLSTYRVIGDVKETSIFMPGIQAILQSYSRLGFSPVKSITRLQKLIAEKDILNGELMIFHSSVNQSGKFDYCCSGYPLPFYFQKSIGNLSEIRHDSAEIQHSEINMEPGDLILIMCNYYHMIVSSDIEEFSGILNQNLSLPADKIRDILLKKIKERRMSTSPDDNRNKSENEDKLFIIIGMEDRH